MPPKKGAQQPKAPEPEPEPEPEAGADDDSDDEDAETSSEAGSEASSSSQPSAGQGAAGAKKKKKKKKKKSKGAGGAAGEAAPAGSPEPSTSGSKVDKGECEKRFTAAMETARSSSDLWVRLPNSNIYDAKTKKLMDALKSNSSVTSLDLSNNHISDEGAQAIAAVLGMGGAPELIELDVRGNPFTPAGLTSLEGLKKIRKQLVVHLGSTASASGMAGDGESMPKGKELKDMSKGPMFRKYFQSGNDDGDGGDDDDERVTDGGIAPEQLWREIASDVAAGPSNIPELGTRLQQLITLLNRELGTLQVPHVDTVTDGSRPHIKGCVMNLETLEKIFGIVPRPVTTQFSAEPQKAVGSHRVWASEVVAQLVAPNIMALDRLVASANLVPRVLQAGLDYPLCSALHTRALRVLRSCCVSKAWALYGPLFTKGLGAGLTTESGEPVPSIQQQLVNHATAALGVPSGSRSAIVGFILEACRVLTQCADEANRDSIYNASVARLLAMDAAWSEFAAPGGPLETLCKEQEGDLGGPRAARVPMDDSADLAELAGGGLISGNEILALLQSMQVSGGLGSMLGS